LVKELLEIGINDAHIDEHGYVYATLPSNSDKKVPTICWCSHMDTSPDCTGKNVNPVIHKKYDGKDIVLPNDKTQILKVDDHADLKDQIGNDVVTADGTTLLGADNKAGLAEIMDAVHHLKNHSEIKHGTIRILFTPDEEIGRGVDKVDMKKLNADYGYTLDGETVGHIEDETFSADAVNININGVSTHPGFAKGKMESAIKIASDILSLLPRDTRSPETTEGNEGFIHPTNIGGTIEKTVIKFIIRSFSLDGLTRLEAFLKHMVEDVMKNYKRSTFEFEIIEQYRNMKLMLDKHPHVTQFAVEAIKRSGLNPHQSSIRGGTDGSRLSYMGLPCPNLFAGEHAFHSKLEWVSVQDMQKAVDTLVNLAIVWEEKTPESAKAK